MAEVVEWTKEAGEVTFFAELQCFAHGQHPFMTWMMSQYAMHKVVLFVLWHCAVAVVVVCCGYAYIHVLYLIYTWFV